MLTACLHCAIAEHCKRWRPAMRKVWPPATRWITKVFTPSAALLVPERKMWRSVARPKAVQFACGKDRLGIAPTCCCPMSRVSGLLPRPEAEHAIGVSFLDDSRRPALLQ